MANVERHDFFPTCLYRFKHDFEENELDSMISHIDLNSLSEHNGQTVKDEIRSLEVINKLNEELDIDIIPTFLGAHSFPEEYENNKFRRLQWRNNS